MSNPLKSLEPFTQSLGTPTQDQINLLIPTLLYSYTIDRAKSKFKFKAKNFINIDINLFLQVIKESKQINKFTFAASNKVINSFNKA